MDDVLRDCTLYLDRMVNALKGTGDAPGTRAPQRATYDEEKDFVWDFNDKDFEYNKLCQLVKNNRSFPLNPTLNLYKRKCQIEMEKGTVEQAAMTLFNSQSFSIQHQAIKQYNTRLLDENAEDEDLTQLEMMSFKSSDDQVLHFMEQVLPGDWTVVQINIDTFTSKDIQSRFKSTPKDDPVVTTESFDLVLAVASKDDNGKVLLNTLKARNTGGNSVIKEFEDILTLHSRYYKVLNATAKRKETLDELDDRMVSLMETMENRMLGFAKIFLLGKPFDDERGRMVEKLVKEVVAEFPVSGPQKKQILKKVIDAGSCLTDEQLIQCLSFVNGEENLKDFLGCVKTRILEEERKRHPVVLILDKEIQRLPWESLRCLENVQPMSRMPSMTFLLTLTARMMTEAGSVFNQGVRSNNIFYILNPDKNLEKTQKRLESNFSRTLGDGVVGEHPTLPKMKEVLSSMDAMMYCGHGSTLKNLPAQEIQKLQIRALPLLFGCNSGRLSRMGRNLDPVGVANFYLIGSAPCLLGFLWAVTDRDLDRWTVEFLNYWLENKEFVRSAAEMRHKFERMTNRAALVVYGLPSIAS